MEIDALLRTESGSPRPQRSGSYRSGAGKVTSANEQPTATELHSYSRPTVIPAADEPGNSSSAGDCDGSIWNDDLDQETGWEAVPYDDVSADIVCEASSPLRPESLEGRPLTDLVSPALPGPLGQVILQILANFDEGFEDFDEEDFDDDFDDDFEEEIEGEYELQDDEYGNEFAEMHETPDAPIDEFDEDDDSNSDDESDEKDEKENGDK